MPVTIRRYPDILPGMLAGLVVRGGLTDIANSAAEKHLVAVTARELEEVYYQIERLLDAFAVKTAVGEDLDERARDYGLEREGATRATGQVVCSRAASIGTPAVIASGRSFLSSVSSGGVAVRATAQGQITTTSPERITGHGVGRDSNPITCVASEPGAAGNVSVGAISRFAGKPAGVDEVTNLVAFTGGRDAETDDELRQRVLDYIAALPHSTVQAIEAATRGKVSASGKTARFVHLYEDPVLPARGSLYVDDGFGTAETTLATAPSGNGSAISAPVANVQTLQVVGTVFASDLVARSITIALATNGVNNGTFPVTAVGSDGRSISYTNAAGVVEAAFAGTWELSPEIVTAAALGGENFLRLAHWPVKSESLVTIRRTRAAVTTTLTPNDSGANGYYLDAASGWLYFPVQLAVNDVIDAEYRYFTDLLALMQKIIDGDPNDATNYPGYRAAGSQIRALPPTTRAIVVQCVLHLLPDTDRPTAVKAAETAATVYINNLGISGDVIWHELAQRIMEVDGVRDITLTIPATNTVILDYEIARVSDADLDIT